MKQTNFQYPTFTTGGVLSKDLLDNLAGYGDEQARLTRARLVGFGIVDGLEYRFESKPCKLILSPGTAITADGNLICADEEKEYYLLKNQLANNELEKYIFSEEPAKKNCSSVNTLPSGYVLALRYARIPATQENCSQQSCDLVNVRTQVRYLPLLHPISMTDRSTLFPQIISGHIEIEKWYDIFTCLNTKMLHKRVRELFNAGCNTLLKKVSEILTCFNSDESAIDYLFDDAVARKHQLQNAYSRLEKLSIRSSGMFESVEIPPYYLEFLEDMKDAVNEFIDAFNGLVSKYTRISTGKRIDDSTLILGIISDGRPDLSDDSYRNYFDHISKGDSFEQECKIVRQFLCRFCTMAEQFSATSYQWGDKPLKLIPINPAASLSDRPIPFYYDTVETKLRKVWKAHSIDLRMMDKCYDSFTNQKSLLLNRSNSGYSVQGYYNQPKDRILSDLNTLISSYCLPLKCQEIRIDDISLSTQTLDILKKKLISPLERIAKDEAKVKNLEDAASAFMVSDSYKNILDLSASYKKTNDSTDNSSKEKKKASVLEIILILLAAVGLMAVPLLRFIKNLDALKRCIGNIRNGESTDLATLKKIESLFAAQRADFMLISNLLFNGMNAKNISEEEKNDYNSSFMIFVAMSVNDKPIEGVSLASDEKEISKQLDYDFVKAFAEFQKYISSIYKPEFLYARDRYAEKNDTIYVAHYRGKVIYCFYNQNNRQMF